MPRIMALPAALIASVFSVTLVAAQPVLLAEPVQTGDCLAVRLELVVKGSLKVARDTSLVSLPLSAIAEQSFTERLLVGGLSGQPARAARRYEIAKATITVDGAISFQPCDYNIHGSGLVTVGDNGTMAFRLVLTH